MLIENLDAFKSWLAKTLAPICDADPSALAKYVVALVKKEKPIEDLRNNCLDNLNVFLQDETNKFVNLLFEAMESKSYIPPAEEKASTPVVIPALDLAAPVAAPLPPASVGGDAHPGASDSSRKDVDMRRGRRDGRGSDDRGRGEGRSRSDKSGPRGGAEKRARSRSPTNAATEAGGTGDLGRSKSPKNSAGNERRSNRDRERDREREPRDGNRERDAQKDRERELPPRHGHGRDRDLRQDLQDRRQGFNSRPRGGPGGYRGGRGGRAPYKRSRSHSYSPGGRGRSRSYSRSWSRSRSRSPPWGKAPPRRRCRDYDEKGYCMAGDLCPDDHGFDPVVVDDVALPTVLPGSSGAASSVKTTVTAGSSAVTSTTTSPSVPAAEGYNPEAPAISHQAPIPAVPIPGLPHPGILGAPPMPPVPPGVMMGQRPPFGPPMSGMPPLGPPPGWGRLPPPTGPPPGMIPREMLPPRGPPPPHMAAMPAAPPSSYDPSGFPAGPSPFPAPTSSTITNPPIPGVPVEPVVSSATRQLVSLNTGDSESADNEVETTVKEYDPTAPSTGVTGPVEIGRNVFGQLSNPQAGGTQQPFNNRPAGKKSNTKLEVKRLPKEYCNLTKLLEHFGKYGEVLNIEVNFRGDPEAALVSYRHPPHAHAAHSNPEPLFNNRFVKIFWHYEGGSTGDSSVTSSSEHRGPRVIPTREKLTFKKKGAEEEETAAEGGDKSKEGTPTQPAKPAKPTADEIRAVQAEMRKALDAKKNASKMKTELLQKKQELLEKQIKEQKFLIERMEKGTMSKVEKETLFKTVKVVTASIQKLKREVEVATFSAVPGSRAALMKKETLPKNPEEAKKVLLDTELDLISAQSSGDDLTTSELRRRVAELKQEALNSGLLSSVRGRGSYRGSVRGRGASWATRGAGSFSFMRSGSIPGMGRGGSQVINRLDRRPKALLVAGFAPDEKDEVLLHLGAIAQIQSHDFDVDSSGKSKLVVSFMDRASAELVATGGSAYKEGQHPPLILKWHQGPPPSPQTPTLPTPPPALVAAERASSICSEGSSTPPAHRKKESSAELIEGSVEEEEEDDDDGDDDEDSGDDDEPTVIINKVEDDVGEDHDESYDFGDPQFGEDEGDVDEGLLLEGEEEEEEDEDRERSWRR